MGPIGCPETPVRNYHSAVRNIPKERVYQNFDVLEVLTINGNRHATPKRPGNFFFPIYVTSLYSHKVLAWPRSFFVENPVDATVRLYYTVIVLL
jgi:hypothetical protein